MVGFVSFADYSFHFMLAIEDVNEPKNFQRMIFFLYAQCELTFCLAQTY